MFGFEKDVVTINIARRAAAAVLVTGALVTAAGCNAFPNYIATPETASASGSSEYQSNPPIVHGESGIAYATDGRRSTNRNGQNGVQFGGLPDSGNANMPRTHQTALVGLYGEVISRPTPLTGQFDGAGNLSQITAAAEGACFDPDINRDGSLMVFASTQHRKTSDIYIKSTAGKTITEITSDPADDLMPTFAPDGRRIAFSSNRDGNWNIYITSTDGSPAMQLTSDAANELHPTWSPSGQKIAYCKLGSQSARWEIWIVDLNTRVHQFLEYGLFPQWNPDPARNKLVFQRARDRGSRLFGIWTLDYIDGEAMYPTEIVSAANAAAMHPSWSPDGSRIVFVTVINPDDTKSNAPEQSDVWLVGLDGTNKTNLTNGRFRNLFPVWSSTGTVFFLSDRSGTENIWAVATNRTLLNEPGPVAPLVSADGQMNDRP